MNRLLTWRMYPRGSTPRVVLRARWQRRRATAALARRRGRCQRVLGSFGRWSAFVLLLSSIDRGRRRRHDGAAARRHGAGARWPGTQALAAVQPSGRAVRRTALQRGGLVSCWFSNSDECPALQFAQGFSRVCEPASYSSRHVQQQCAVRRARSVTAPAPGCQAIARQRHADARPHHHAVGATPIIDDSSSTESRPSAETPSTRCATSTAGQLPVRRRRCHRAEVHRGWTARYSARVSRTVMTSTNGRSRLGGGSPRRATRPLAAQHREPRGGHRVANDTRRDRGGARARSREAEHDSTAR